MRQRFIDLVDQDQAQIAFAQFAQRDIDGDEFALDFFHVAGALRSLQAVAA